MSDTSNLQTFGHVLFDENDILRVHCSHGEANKYTQGQLVNMKTQDIGHVRQQSQAEAKVWNSQSGAFEAAY